MIRRPDNLITSDYFAGYVNRTQEEDLLKGLEKSLDCTLCLLNGLSDSEAGYSYSEGKWTIKQVVQHLTDTERVFTYRALSIARGDRQNLCGFDEDGFAENDCSSNRNFSDILKEFEVVRKSTILLFDSFSSDVLDNIGAANGVNFTPRILGWVLLGHELHHVGVIKERYLLQD
ncbi:MAG: DinB family protein [Flavobacteriales bacterium]|nr:DinB family protein [Flavobacteriales bacterium]